MSQELEEKFAGIRAYLRVARHLNARSRTYHYNGNFAAALYYKNGLISIVRAYNQLWGPVHTIPYVRLAKRNVWS